MLDYWRTGAFEKEVSVRHTFSVKSSTMTIAAKATPEGMLDVTLTNTTANEIDLTGWQLLTATHFYNIPPSTIILANKSLTLTARSTGFVAAEESSLRLVDPSSNTIASVITVLPPVVAVAKVSSITLPPVAIAVPLKLAPTSNANFADIKIPNETLVAQAVKIPETSKSYLSWFLLAALIILGASSIIFLRRARTTEDESPSLTEADKIQIIE